MRNTGLERAGLTVRTEQSSPTCVRLVVADAVHTTIVDLAWDARLQPPVPSPVGPLISEEELAADKLLALFGRAEARDFIDVHQLAQRHGFDRLCDLAHEKDAGFSRELLADSLGQFQRLDRDDFELDDRGYAALSRWIADLHRSLDREVDPPEPPGLEL